MQDPAVLPVEAVNCKQDTEPEPGLQLETVNPDMVKLEPEAACNDFEITKQPEITKIFYAGEEEISSVFENQRIDSDTTQEIIEEEFNTIIDQPVPEWELSIGQNVTTSAETGGTNETIDDIIAGIIGESATVPTETRPGPRAAEAEEVDPEFLNDFLVETKEHIENIEMNVLALETDPGNLELIHGLFREFHTIKGLAGFVNQDVIREIAHQTETKMDDCRKGKIQVNKGVIDLILASSDYIKLICDNLNLNHDPKFLDYIAVQLEALKHKTVLVPEEHQETVGDNVNDPKCSVKIGEILMEQGIEKETIEELLAKQEEYPGLKLGQVAVKEKVADAKEIIQSLRVQERSARKGIADGGYTRIGTMKVDNLVDLTGELVIIQSQIEQEAIKRFGTNDAFITKLLRAQKLSKDIQNISMSLRMVSLKSTFQKAYRIGRDTIAELGKNVNLEIQGEETEIDRAVTDKLLDPLLHLIKNSISHGIEPEAERLAKGKPAQGQVKIKAYGKRGNVYIEVSDDGQGMDLERIHNKAVERGLLDSAHGYSDEEVLNVIFMPGFSTTEDVNNISGRGVGLDVVKTEISRIGGKIDIHNRPDLGCTFILKIPINLAAINGTIVDIGGSRYIIPTLYIKQILKPGETQWISITGNRTMVRNKDEILPLIPITKVFELTETELDRYDTILVVLELEQKFKALPVRKVIDRREIVVKPLGSEFSNLNYMAGASILGDGVVALILDVENLFKMEDFRG